MSNPSNSPVSKPQFWPDLESSIRVRWEFEQNTLKSQLIEKDAFEQPISRVGGVDISFSQDDENVACACFVVLSFPDLKVRSFFSFLETSFPWIHSCILTYLNTGDL